MRYIERFSANFGYFKNIMFNSIFAKNVLKIASGNFIAQLITLVLTPVLSRIIDPIIFGEFSVFTSAYSVISSVVSLGLISAVISSNSDEEAKDIFQIVAFSILFLSSLVFIILVLLTPVYRIINISINYGTVILLILISLSSSNLLNLVYSFANRQKLYNFLFWFPISSSILNYLSIFILLNTNLNRYSLILGQIFSQTVIFIYTLYILKSKIEIKSLDHYQRVLSKYSDFIKYQMSSNLIKSISSNWPIIMMSSIFGNYFLGQYSLSQRVLFVPITFLGSAIGQVHFRKASEIYNNSLDPGLLTFSIIKYIMFVLFIPFLFVSVLGPPIITLLLGDNWLLAGKILSIRSYETIIMTFFFSTSYIFVVLKLQRLVVLNSIISLLCSLFSILIGGFVFHDYIFAIVLLSLFNSLMYIFFYSIMFSNTEIGSRIFLVFIGKYTIAFFSLRILFEVILRIVFG